MSRLGYPRIKTDVDVGEKKADSRQASEIIARNAVPLVLLAMIIAFSVALPQTFASLGNFQVMVNSQAVILMLALAVTIPLRTGDFDLSVPNTMVLSAMLLGVLTKNGVPWPLAIVAVLLVGFTVGFINGVLIVKVDVNAFITTLGMFTILGGIAFALTDGRRADVFPDLLATATRTKFLGLPLLTFYAWILVIVIWYIYECTPLGRRLLFIGGNRDAARLAGVRVDSVRIGAFVASSVIATVAGVLFAGWLGSIDPGIGSQYLLPPYAAAFLGATTIKLGRFNAIGTLVGLYLLIVGITGLQLMGGQPWVSDVFNGAALISAVAFAQIVGRRHA